MGFIPVIASLIFDVCQHLVPSMSVKPRDSKYIFQAETSRLNPTKQYTHSQDGHSREILLM